MNKRPYMPHRRRFLAIGAPTRPTPAAREIERLQRENRLLRSRLATISDMTLTGLDNPSAGHTMLHEIDKALNGDYDPEVLT